MISKPLETDVFNGMKNPEIPGNPGIQPSYDSRQYKVTLTCFFVTRPILICGEVLK